MKLTMDKVDRLAEIVANRIKQQGTYDFVLVGIPRGGIPAAYAIAKHMDLRTAVTSIEDNLSGYHRGQKLVLVDDITTTGKTLEDALRKMPNPLDTLIAVLLSKSSLSSKTTLYGEKIEQDDWVEFPWEAKEQGGKPLDAVVRLIEYVGDDPTRDGLKETPARVLRFLDEIRKGQEYEPTVFKSDVKDLQITRHIPFASLCEHHMMPYWGEAAIAYVPSNKVIGLSKFARGLYDLASGLTIQEELTHKMAEKIAWWMKGELFKHADVAVVTKASHSCMIARGVRAYGTDTISSAMLGKFRTEPSLRAEFMSLAGIS